MTQNDLMIISKSTEISMELREDAQKVKDYIEDSSAKSTRKAYERDWNDFRAWCQTRNLEPLPATPLTVASYITELLDVHNRKITTIQRRLVAISQAHNAMNLDSPSKSLLVKKTLKGIKNTHDTAPVRKKAAVKDEIKAMVYALKDDLLGTRDRALILVGFAGAFRRSELVGLNVEDIEFTNEGMVINLRRSKTDQEGQGYKKGIPFGYNGTCPVNALKRWLEAASITSGSIFRGMNRHGQVLPNRLTDQVVAKVVKRAAEAADLDPQKYAGHSLRSGLATSAAAAGAQERDIMRQTGHRSVQMVRRYIQEGELFRNNAAGTVGL